MYFIRLFLFSVFLIVATKNYAEANTSDTVKLYFEIGKYAITTNSQKALDSCLYNDIIKPGSQVGIIGYADYLGDSVSNLTLSVNRANSIKEYLLSMHIAEKDIEIVTGKGEINRSDVTGSQGYPTDRRVDIVLGGFKKKTHLVIPQKTIANPIDIKTIRKNEAIRLDNIFFYPGRHAIREQSLNALNSLYTLMKENNKLRIRIEGHICCETENTADGYDFDTHMYNLSEARAKAVYDFLINKDIDDNRLEYKGYGKTRPLKDPELNEEDQNMNRRVEIRIIEK